MRALTFWKIVTRDQVDFLEKLLTVLRDTNVSFCVIGGQAVNAYASPLVSLDLDLVIAVEDLDRFLSVAEGIFQVERHSHNINLHQPGSELRVQIQTDARYLDFPSRALTSEVLGVQLPVARIQDLLQGTIWAALDPLRRPSKRRKDLLDIERLVEAHPDLANDLPPEIAGRLAI